MSLLSANTSDPNAVVKQNYRLPLHGLATLRILIVLTIGLGYASTMGIGTESAELGNHWGYDPSWYGVQLLFIFSGFLAARSMTHGRSIKDFFQSRMLSLWPSLIAATLFCVCLIYPLMCAPDAPVRMSAAELAIYTLKTIFLIDPGGLMPGLMDDAKYMCLLQGAIWTLRIGLILHVAFILGWLTRILQNRRLVLMLCVTAIAVYVTSVDRVVWNPDLIPSIEPLFPAMRLGYAYLIGITIYLWQDKLRLNPRRILLSATGIALLTTSLFTWAPWSSVLEILGVSVWLTICLGFLHSAPLFLRKCPRLTPVLYVSIWPAAQVTIALVPGISQIGAIEMSVALASFMAIVAFLLLRQARIQPARL